MMPSQRLYVGRIHVNFNGDDHSKCEIYINYDVAPSILLSSDGLVFYKTDRQDIHFRRIACHHKGTTYLSAWHHQALPLERIARPQQQEKIHYFGDIHVVWKIDPTQTIEAAQKVPTSNLPYKEGRLNNSGEIQVTVSNQLQDVEALLVARWPEVREKKFLLEEALVSVKK